MAHYLKGGSADDLKVVLPLYFDAQLSPHGCAKCGGDEWVPSQSGRGEFCAKCRAEGRYVFRASAGANGPVEERSAR